MNQLSTLDHLANIQKAAEHLQSVLDPTPLIPSAFFSSEYHNNVYIKPENLQKTGSFKIRGAYNKIMNLSDADRQKGIITASAGNHAQGVAYSAARCGAPATIVMPVVTPLIKIESAREKGAQVVIHGNIYDEAYQKALSLAQEHDYTFVHAYNDYDVICGQGTIALEILRDLPEIDEILVPVGGGGLISGIVLAAKALKPTVRVIGVEPAGAASMNRALTAGKVVPLEQVKTSAEGVAVREVGSICYDIVSQYADGIIEVSEQDIMEALLLLLEKHKIIAETSGVLPLAALKKLNSRNKNIACVVTGGNIDMVTISSVINTGLIGRGRIFCFSVDLPDNPGQLLNIAQLLNDQRANVIKLDHNQFKATDRYANVQLEVTVETNGHQHIAAITAELERAGYEIVRIY